MQDDELRDVIGYEGLYKISRSGKVFRCSRMKRLNNGRYTELAFMQLQTNAKVYYPCVALNKNGRQRTFYLHRLVAVHFIPNDDPKNKREVNHKDKDIFNFNIDNLEWVTRSENVKHAKKKKVK